MPVRLLGVHWDMGAAMKCERQCVNSFQTLAEVL